MPFGFEYGDVSTQPPRTLPTAGRMRVVNPVRGPTGRGGGAPGNFRDQKSHLLYEVRGLRGQLRPRDERANRINQLYDQSLADPIGTAEQFKEGFGDFASAWAAPQQREFQNTIAGVAGNVASRFGGNASSEEQRQVNQAGDVFSRNLTEGIARLAPEAFQAGAQYTSELGGASSDAQARADRIRAMILEGVLGIRDKQKTNIFGQALGAAAGIATKFI